MGLGLQEFIIIAMALVVCMFLVLPVVGVIVVARRYQARKRVGYVELLTARGVIPPVPTDPPSIPAKDQPGSNEWGETKFGFDDADWDDDANDKPLNR